jgi:hypothetical protein
MKSVNLGLCAGVYGVLCDIYRILGYLPQGKTPADLREMDGDVLLEYARVVTNDVQLWKKISPQTILPLTDSAADAIIQAIIGGASAQTMKKMARKYTSKTFLQEKLVRMLC